MPRRQLRHIQRQVAAEDLALMQCGGGGEHGGAAAAVLGSTDSDDSEAELAAGLGGQQALPRLEAGAAGGAASVAAAAAALDLLPGEGSGLASSSCRISSASDGAAAAIGEGRVTWGTATHIPTHFAEGKQGSTGAGAGGSARPSSARRATGSGNALLRRAAGGGGRPAEVLSLGSGLPRSSLQPGDSDF